MMSTNNKISKKVFNLFLIAVFLFPNTLSYQPLASSGEGSNPTGDALAKISPNLKRGFQAITLDYDTSTGVKVTADYSLKDGVSPISGNKPVKQLITLDNPTDQDIPLTLNINHTINAETFYWDGKEYQVTNEPQTFKAYKSTTNIDPQDELYDETFKDLPEEEREGLPQITNVPTYKGTSISFKTPDGQTAIYDFSDVANLEHEVTISREASGEVGLTLTLSQISASSHSQTVIDPTYDMATSSNYNLRYDGAAAFDNLSFVSLFSGDLNNNGETDLLVGACVADNNSRDHSGSLWIIYDSLIDDYTGTGNNIDLADSSNYNLRYDGASAADKLTQGGMPAIAMADLDNDGQQDLLIGAQATDYNGRGGSGSLYIFYDSLLDNYTGTGNNIDLANSSTYNLRYDGPTSSDYITYGCLLTADVDNDGRQDVLIGAAEADYNGTDSGSLWVIYNTLINHTSETGNTVDLADSSTYNLRYDGAAAGDFFTFGATVVVDLDSNSRNDILVGAAFADNNSRNLSGSLYIIYDTLIDDYTETGNTVDMGTSSNYNLRYDGATAGDYFVYCALNTADLDNDSKPDILTGSALANYNSRHYSGSLWVIYNTLIDDYLGTGNNIDLADSSNYNLRYDGAAAGDFLTYVGGLTVTDLDSDGQNDILVGAPYADNDSCLYSGSLYVIYNTLIDDHPGTGNNIDLATSTNYNLRYNGATEWQFFFFASGIRITDLNNDGRRDVLVGSQSASYNSRTSSGSLYIIYNFPHSLSLDSILTPRNSNSLTLTGSISVSNSVTNISGVQYQVDSNEIAGAWTACSASDGSFNSTSESFSCSLSGLADGSHTVYIRSYDANTSYTAQASYGSATFTVDVTSPGSGVISINSGASYTTSRNVTLTISADGAGEMKVSENSSFANADWEGYKTSKDFILSTDDGEKRVYIKFRDAAGNETGSDYDTIILDTEAPYGSIAITSGASQTKSRHVRVTIKADDATSGLDQMIISENPDFKGAVWEDHWWDHSVPKTMYLSPPEGQKTLYIKFKDKAGHKSERYSAGVTYDPTAPPLPILTNLGTLNFNPSSTNWYYTETKPTLKGTAEANSIVTITISSETVTGSTTANSSGNWEYTPEGHLSTGTHQVLIKVQDSTGNESETLGFNLTIDPTASLFPPEILALVPEIAPAPTPTPAPLVEEIKETTPAAVPSKTRSTPPSEPTEGGEERVWKVLGTLAGPLILVLFLIYRRRPRRFSTA